MANKQKDLHKAISGQWENIERNLKNLLPAANTASSPREPFLYGVSASAYQTEGDDGTQGRGACVWDTFCEKRGAIYGGQNAKIAADHYHLYKQDVEMLADLGVNAYRFSVSWSRILPEGTGRVNEKGIAFYSDLIDRLLARGIQPVLTMYHWDLPETLSERGGFRNREFVEWFANYAKILAENFGDRVKFFITFNEPINSIHSSYYAGIFAPGYRLSETQALKCLHHLLLAHAAAYRSIMQCTKDKNDVKIGIAMSTFEQYPEKENKKCVAQARKTFFEREIATESVDTYLDPVYLGKYPARFQEKYPEFMRYVTEEDLEKIKGTANVICYNGYGGTPIDENGGEVGEKAGAERTAMGASVDPRAIFWNCLFLQERYCLPVYITENGAAYEDALSIDGKVHDSYRANFLETHLRMVEEAVRRGVDIRGYFVWSLLDNFEWLFGYAKRFGLVYVDYETLKRIPKDSFYAYREYIKNAKK